MRVLVLCSGTGSIDRAFERRGWDVTSVDWLAKFGPTLCVDIMEWDYRAAFPKDHFQFVWASPACTHFSLARTTGGPRDIEGATALVTRGALSWLLAFAATAFNGSMSACAAASAAQMCCKTCAFGLADEQPAQPKPAAQA